MIKVISNKLLVIIKAINKIWELEEMLRTLTDLRGILFLYTHENPTANVDPTQIDQIYNKTKSEATRLVQQEKSMTVRRSKIVKHESCYMTIFVEID